MDLEDFLSLQLPLFINVLVLISLLLLTNVVYSQLISTWLFLMLLLFITIKIAH